MGIESKTSTEKRREELTHLVQINMDLVNSKLPGLSKVSWDKWGTEHKGEQVTCHDYPVSDELKLFYPFSFENTEIAYFTSKTGAKNENK